MSSDTPQDHVTKKRVVYDLPGADTATVQFDIEFLAADGGVLTMDMYRPPDSIVGAQLPVVVIVAGYPDTGTKLPCRFKEMAWTTSWGRLIAASGMSAIAYTNRQPIADLHSLFGHIRNNATGLGIDADRIGLWAASGNVPLALSMLMRDAREPVSCAALGYGFTIDLDGRTHVADAAKRYGFVNACAGRSVDDLSNRIPLFLVRAGRDEFPYLNETLDRLVAHAIGRNLPVSFVNHPDAPHAFDLFYDTATSREIIRQTLAFMRFNLDPTAAL
jgi:hypothetical protein